MSRAEVRLFTACPECGAPPGQKCITEDNRPRVSNHQGRVNAHRDKMLATKVQKENKVEFNEMTGKMPFNELRIERKNDTSFELTFVNRGQPLVSVSFQLPLQETFSFSAVTGDLHYKFSMT